MATSSSRLAIDPSGDTEYTLTLTEAVVSAFGLKEWAAGFSLMTAGYRDHIDPNDFNSADVPFNSVTVAIMAEAKGRVFRRKSDAVNGGGVHVGGEVRTHTQACIQIAARVYAAQGFRVHLRREISTSPIWYSSFAVVYNEHEGGDNFTASHSPYFKLGWKVLDKEGKEVTAEEADIIAEVQRLVESNATIKLAPWRSSGRIEADVDVDTAYAEYQRTVLGSDVLGTITRAAHSGFKCAATTLGGSMGATSKRIFRALGVPADAISYFLDSEDSRFHRVGEIGDHNFGADVGKLEVCANTGAPATLLSGDADLVLLWDPDGDRLNIMTTAPIAMRARAVEFGLTLGPSSHDRMVVYFTPNQLYLILVDYRISLLRKLGLLERYNWFIGTTFPTSMAIEELAQQEGVPTIRVPVGFRNLGDLCQTIEAGRGHTRDVEMLTGRPITVGPEPRALILCEESGGATLGGPNLIASRTGANQLLALREKDGMQLSLLAWSAAAWAAESGTTMAARYCEIVSTRDLKYRHNVRLDITLYDERFTGDELRSAKTKGLIRRDQIVEFFRDAASSLSEGRRSPDAVKRILLAASPETQEAAVPELLLGAWIGDGSLFELDRARLIVRASGTDALIRYYLEATSSRSLENLRKFVSGLNL